VTVTAAYWVTERWVTRPMQNVFYHRVAIMCLSQTVQPKATYPVHRWKFESSLSHRDKRGVFYAPALRVCFSRLVVPDASILPPVACLLRGGVALRSAFARLASSIIISSCVNSPATGVTIGLAYHSMPVSLSRLEKQRGMLRTQGLHAVLHDYGWYATVEHLEAQQLKGDRTSPASANRVQCRVGVPH
jgi:hypothetical protein